MRHIKLFESFVNEGLSPDLDNIPNYSMSQLDEIERSGYHQAVTFYPKRSGGHAFTIAGKVDAMRMYNELEKNNIDGRVVFGPFFHSGVSRNEPKSLTVIVDKNDLKKVIDVIKNSDDLELNPPLHPSGH